VADIGAVLGGRYRLIELLGQGGMATIYRARDTQLERDVAVKVLRPEYGNDPDFFARFRQEAQSAASLNHPGVVSVYDYGTDEVGPFIVMELVDGEDLATILRRTGALTPRQAARIVSQAARAIAAAHDRGFVHRDIKPGNILLTRDGRVKVADFGIARAMAESALTMPGTTLGSVHYFSPEQARGELAGQASDIYSLGIVLYELLTGRRPWIGDTAAAIATARLSGAIPSVAAVRPGVPQVLEAIDQKALALDPEDRFASASDMADALEGYLNEGFAPPAADADERFGAVGARGSAAGAAAGALAGATLAADSSPTIAAGVARPNPDARMAAEEFDADAMGSRYGARRIADGNVAGDEPAGRSAWVWLSALLALLVLGLAAFLVLRLVSSGGPTQAEQVVVPNFVGMTFDQAKDAAVKEGLTVSNDQQVPSSDAPKDTVVAQDPVAGEKVAKGGVVKLTVSLGAETTIVPDLRGKVEQEALNLIAQAGLAIGTRTEAFDPFIPAGSVVSQDPGAGAPAAKETQVNYVISKGPEPTATPTAPPTPAPTPTPEPTPTPTPKNATVGDYKGVALSVAQAQIDADGFKVGTVTPDGAQPDWCVIDQSPNPGAKRPPGSAIDLTVDTAPCP
jgi:serine/threonine-protein kinase